MSIVADNACSQIAAVLLSDFIVFLSRIASVPGIRQKMTTTKWTSLLLEMISYDKTSGKWASVSFLAAGKCLVCEILTSY